MSIETLCTYVCLSCKEGEDYNYKLVYGLGTGNGTGGKATGEPYRKQWSRWSEGGCI